MKLDKPGQIAVVVKDVEAATKYLHETFGIGPFALVKFDTGQTLFAEVSWDAHQEPLLAYHIFGEQGGATWEKWEKTLTVYHDDRRGKTAETTVKPKGKDINPYWHFVEACLDRRTKMIASGEECLNVIRVLDAIARSQKFGKAVAV